MKFPISLKKFFIKNLGLNTISLQQFNQFLNCKLILQPKFY